MVSLLDIVTLAAMTYVQPLQSIFIVSTCSIHSPIFIATYVHRVYLRLSYTSFDSIHKQANEWADFSIPLYTIVYCEDESFLCRWFLCSVSLLPTLPDLS